MADGTQPRRGHDQEREPKVASKVRHGVALPDRDEQPTGPLHEDDLVRRRHCSKSIENQSGLNRSPLPTCRRVRRERGFESVGADRRELLVAPSCGQEL